MKELKIYRLLVLLIISLFSCIDVIGSSYHITSSSDFKNTSSWVNIYDTIYLDNDIDLLNESMSPINTFSGVFDGNGNTIRGINISTTSNSGLFLNTENAYIHDLKLYGKITGNSSRETTSVGLICTAKSTTLTNIENHIKIVVNSPKSAISGFVCVTDASKLLIESCKYCDSIIIHPKSFPTSSYGGTYAFNQCGGIIATLKENDMVSNCLFSGHIWVNIPYNPTPIVNVKNNYVVEGYNYDGNLGGIAGYCGAATNTSGIQNCLVTGTFNLNGNWFKNQGAIAGIISSSAKNSNNYFCNDTITYASTTTKRSGETNGTSKNPGSTNSTEVNSSDVTDGSVYDMLNEGGGSSWGQYPLTSYNMDNNKNYVFDYFYFDDDGDETKFPKDATSIFIEHIKYKRSAKYVKGMMSVCLPFEVSKLDGSLPDGEIYEYSHTDTDNDGNVLSVNFKLSNNQNTINAGDAVFFKPSVNNVDWVVNKYNSSVVMNPNYGLISAIHNDREGINGTFNTYKIGTGYFKINTNGDGLVYTTANSKCYPYRTYIKLPEGNIIPTNNNSNQTPVRVVFSNKENDYNVATSNKEYNILKSNKIFKDNKLIIIVNGEYYNTLGIKIK